MNYLFAGAHAGLLRKIRQPFCKKIHKHAHRRQQATSMRINDVNLSCRRVPVGQHERERTVLHCRMSNEPRATAGTTCRYTADGPIGLAREKQVIIASARGGIYSTGPAMAMDQQETLLSTAFGLMGIDSLQFVRAEGLAMGPEHREQAMNEGAKAISSLRTVAAAA